MVIVYHIPSSKPFLPTNIKIKDFFNHYRMGFPWIDQDWNALWCNESKSENWRCKLTLFFRQVLWYRIYVHINWCNLCFRLHVTWPEIIQLSFALNLVLVERLACNFVIGPNQGHFRVVWKLFRILSPFTPPQEAILIFKSELKKVIPFWNLLIKSSSEV